MSNFPNSLDDDTTLPRVDGNITDIGGDAINALRSAMFAVESTIGVNAQGATASVAARISTSLDPLGRIMPSALAGIGLVYLPITDSEISPTAAIQESKLSLIYSTSTLYNLYQNLKNSIDVLNGFLSLTGIKVEPHIAGTAYNHELSAIFVDTALPMLKTLPGPTFPVPGTSVQNRNTTNADTLIKDISDDLLTHEKADGTPSITASLGGTVPPEGFAHVATGLYIDSTPFSVIPQSNNTLQKFAEFVDSSSLLLLGSRTQNLFSNGVSRAARSFSLTADGYGSSIVPPTPIVAYLLNVPPGPIASSPVDNINNGDDVILFQPTATQLSTFNFDAQFSQVVPGDALTVNYGNGFSAQFAVESVKAIVNGSTRVYAVRINSKNPFPSSDGYAQIDRPLYNTNKYGILSVTRCPNQLGSLESLIVSSPKGAIVLGNGFNPSLFDSQHYNLYLTMYQGGNPSNILSLPAIDITGNLGTTPGQYTLDTIVNSTNEAFRTVGFNYRFVAFEYQGEFGIMLADSYNNTSFSIISGTVNISGAYTSTSLSAYPGNVVDNYGDGLNAIDPLGFGVLGANVASPPSSSYASVAAAQFAPTLLFYPLSRNYFYANGVERDSLRSDPSIINQIVDGYGDGYWPATILPSPSTLVLANRVQVAYQVNLDLSTSGIRIGKTIVIQPVVATTDPSYNFRDYGRFIVQNLSFTGCDTANPITVITVYDGVHGAGVSPAITSTNIPVNIYFSDDSVSFDAQNVADQSSTGYPYKRFFEVYIDQNGHTFTHERARFSPISNGISSIGLYSVSPKLSGYATAINANEYLSAIQLTITNYNATTGIYSGQLLNPNTSGNPGPITIGKKGQPTRFYDETNIDYIDFIFDASDIVGSWVSPSQSITVQLFKSLELDQEDFLLATCQLTDSTGQVAYLTDKRQFGNTSEENFTTSALDYIAAPTRLLAANGIIRGFDILGTETNKIEFDGGEAVVNGKIVQLNPQVIEIPVVLEAVNASIGTTVNIITWFICVNSSGELVLVASTDYDPNGSFASIYEGLSLDNTRLFYAMNPNLSLPVAYQVRGTYFGDLVINQTDLTPIAVAVATATASGGGIYSITTLTANDARRYVGGGFGGMAEPFVLSAAGSFRSLAAVSTWLTQLCNFFSATSDNGTNNPIGNTVILKGDITIISPLTLNFLTPITFKGDGGAFIVAAASGIIVTNGVTFDGVRFDYTHTPTGGEGYVSANLVNSINAAIYCNVATSNQNIAIKNCTFNSFAVDHYPFISFEFTGSQSVLQNVLIENNRFVDNAGAQDLRAAIVFNSKSNSPPGSFPFTPKMVNCLIKDNLCNNDQMFIITSPRSASGLAEPPFVGCVNVRIDGNTCGTIGFLTQDTYPSTSDNSNYSGLVQDKGDNLYITSNTCKFIAQLDATGQYISFLTQATYGPGLGAPINSALPWEPATFVITNATNASPIVITATTSNPSLFTTGLLVTVGSVGGNTAANVQGNPITLVSSTSGSVTFSLNGTTGNGTYTTGSGFVYAEFVSVNNATGAYVISGNTACWIQTGSLSGTHGGGDGIIEGNRLYPYEPTFLQNYTDTIFSVAPVNAGIVLTRDNGEGTTFNRIANNVMGFKTDFNGTQFNYRYDQGIICLGQAQISNNFIDACVTSSANTCMIYVVGGDIAINNRLKRGSSAIGSYINSFQTAYDLPSGISFNPGVVVTNNSFDSQYVDAANTITNETNVNFIDNAEYIHNINQILYAAIPMYEMTSLLNNVSTQIFPVLISGESDPPNVFTPVSINSTIQCTTASPPAAWYGMTNLAKYLPTGAKLLYIVLGMQSTSSFTSSTSPASTLSMAIVKQPSAQINLSSLTNSLVDVANDTTYADIYTYIPSTAIYLINNSTQANKLSGGTTQYLEIDMSLATQNFTVGKDNEVKLIFQAYNLLVATNPTELNLSPVVIRYTFR